MVFHAINHTWRGRIFDVNLLTRTNRVENRRVECFFHTAQKDSFLDPDIKDEVVYDDIQNLRWTGLQSCHADNAMLR
ncbi:uncharacterized protein MYCGRDRAFT_104278 [Zymoseptoria tritici IPO323]|uniref:Uncharacterized protein n=1 Tax=Zymoseptoria tritici (strain CBS 115943 / IPO323) TaxID=336722 RepID=F9XAC0_ZYMTI|nr:uncharacterized protein MYCGRDRAFT_104278 [Zymoseptoria tritici IPO323]EGP88089.1 hypothetical protein MYCGRDRAFT_104278 [Zymoseptoria tritici IPO323]